MPPLRPSPALLRSNMPDLFSTCHHATRFHHTHTRSTICPSILRNSLAHKNQTSTSRTYASQSSTSNHPNRQTRQPRSNTQAQTRTRAQPPQTHDRGPQSTEDTQTDFGSLNVLGNTPAPSTAIDACAWDGFHLNNGVKVAGSGVVLVAGESFAWRPWEAGAVGSQGGVDGSLYMVNGKGQWEVGDGAWGLLGLVWPKPDLLILGLGKEMRPISPRTRQYINSLGIRIEISDTRNAAAQFNLLATERGVGTVAAALVPLGWREGVGIRTSSNAEPLPLH